MSLALRCQPACEVVDRFLAGYSEAEIIEARRAPRYTSLGFPDPRRIPTRRVRVRPGKSLTRPPDSQCVITRQRCWRAWLSSG